MVLCEINLSSKHMNKTLYIAWKKEEVLVHNFLHFGSFYFECNVKTEHSYINITISIKAIYIKSKEEVFLFTSLTIGSLSYMKSLIWDMYNTNTILSQSWKGKRFHSCEKYTFFLHSAQKFTWNFLEHYESNMSNNCNICGFRINQG